VDGLSLLLRVDANATVGAGIAVGSFPAAVRPGSDADAQLVQEAKTQRAHVVLLDGYEFSAHYLASLRQDGRLVVYIDDFTQLDLSVDVIVDPNVGASSASRGAGVTLLAGGCSRLFVRSWCRLPTINGRSSIRSLLRVQYVVSISKRLW